MVAGHERAEQVQRDLWHDFLMRERADQRGAARGGSLREREDAELAALQPGPISREQVADEAWYEAVAQAHAEAAAQVRAHRMTRADAFAESFVKDFIRAHLDRS